MNDHQFERAAGEFQHPAIDQFQANVLMTASPQTVLKFDRQWTGWGQAVETLSLQSS